MWKNNSLDYFYKKTILKDKPIDKNEYKKTLNEFLIFARKSIPENIPIIIFFHPSYTLKSDGSLVNNTDKWYLDTFAEASKSNNIIFIYNDNELTELYKTRNILPYGFINTKVNTGHLNRYGHEVIAKSLVNKIMEMNIIYNFK